MTRPDPDQWPEHTVRTLTPEPKVVAGGVAGALGVLLAYILDVSGLELPPAVSGALVTLLAVLAAYFRSNGDRGM